MTKRVHILGLYVWVLLYFHCVFILIFIEIFTLRSKPIKTEEKSSCKWQKRKRAAKAHAKIWKLKEGSQWDDTALCMQGNKQESEPSLDLTLAAGVGERAANSGLPRKWRSKEKEDQTKSGTSLGVNCLLRNKKKFKNILFPKREGSR